MLLIAIILFIAAAVLFVLSYNKARKMHRLEEVRNHIARDLHDDIGATLTSISFFTQAALTKLKLGKYEDADHIITQTGDTAREAIGNMNDIVWFINPNNDQLRALFSRIEDHARKLFSERGITFYFYYKDDDLNTMLDIEQRKHLYLICKEALTNAAKYARCKNVELLVEQKYIIIRDDGEGFDQTGVAQGNGLLNMKVRAHQLGAHLTLKSAPGKGTTVKLDFRHPHKR